MNLNTCASIVSTASTVAVKRQVKTDLTSGLVTLSYALTVIRSVKTSNIVLYANNSGQIKAKRVKLMVKLDTVVI
jgi:hypothetical protein